MIRGRNAEAFFVFVCLFFFFFIQQDQLFCHQAGRSLLHLLHRILRNQMLPVQINIMGFRKDPAPA